MKTIINKVLEGRKTQKKLEEGIMILLVKMDAYIEALGFATLTQNRKLQTKNAAIVMKISECLKKCMPYCSAEFNMWAGPRLDSLLCLLRFNLSCARVLHKMSQT